jgi:hypothetical protein
MSDSQYEMRQVAPIDIAHMESSPTGDAETVDGTQHKVVMCWAPDFDKRIKKLNLYTDYARIGFNILITGLLAVYLVLLAMQASENYSVPDVRSVPVSKTSISFPVVLICPVLGSTATTLSNANCFTSAGDVGKGTPCATRTKSIASFRCLEFNYDKDALAGQVADTMELSLEISTLTNSSTEVYPGAEVFMHDGVSIISGDDIKTLLATNFVVQVLHLGIVHIRRNEYVDVDGTTTKVAFPFTFTSTALAGNVSSVKKTRLRFTYEEMIVTQYQQVVTKDVLFVLGAVGGAYSLLAISTTTVMIFRETRRKQLLKKIEKEAKEADLLWNPSAQVIRRINDASQDSDAIKKIA